MTEETCSDFVITFDQWLGLTRFRLQVEMMEMAKKQPIRATAEPAAPVSSLSPCTFPLAAN